MKITKHKLKVVKSHLSKWSGFYLASIIWAFIFRQLGKVPYKALEMGGTDYWGWLIFTYLALATGWAFGGKGKEEN